MIPLVAAALLSVAHPRPGADSLRNASDGSLARFDVAVLRLHEPALVFLGYGREMRDREAFRFEGLAPRNDGFFPKTSYPFRS
jgi:hypothetical protein